MAINNEQAMSAAMSGMGPRAAERSGEMIRQHSYRLPLRCGPALIFTR
jgi:hypothetical protein